MTKDPIIAEIRRFRDRYARKHGYSVRAIAEDLRRFEAAQASRPGSVQPKAARKSGT